MPTLAASVAAAAGIGAANIDAATMTAKAVVAACWAIRAATAAMLKVLGVSSCCCGGEQGTASGLCRAPEPSLLAPLVCELASAVGELLCHRLDESCADRTGRYGRLLLRGGALLRGAAHEQRADLHDCACRRAVLVSDTSAR